MMEVLVFSKRIIERTLSGEATGEIAAWNGDMHCSLRQPNMAAVLPPLNLAALQKLLWDEAGIVRDGQGLEQAAVILAGWQAGLPQSCDRASWELSNLVLAGRLMVESALMRCESRGAHYRSDFPGSSDAWRKHIIQIKGG
jgi:L-aspartate oxidase